MDASAQPPMPAGLRFRLFGVPVVLAAGSALLGILFAAFAAMLALSASLTPAQAALCALLAGSGIVGSLLAHELGHMLCARLNGASVIGICCSWFGAATYVGGSYRDGGVAARVALAGPAASLLLALASAPLALLPLPSGIRAGLLVIAATNALILLLNLLPVPPLDGYRFILGCLACRSSGQAELIASRIGNGFVCLLLAAALLLLLGSSFSLAAVLLVLALSLELQRKLGALQARRLAA